MNTRRHARFPRRLVLRSAAAAVTLPLLPSVAPRPARGAAPRKRLVLWFQPDGIMEAAKLGFEPWWPAGSETAFTLAPHSKPLEALKGDLVFLRGIHNTSSTKQMLDSIHGTMLRHMLTGGGPSSLDQVIADRVGGTTRFRSLELGVATSTTGKNDTRMSYRDGAALTPEPDPTRVYARLFGAAIPSEPRPSTTGNDEAVLRLLQRRKSVLDGVLQEIDAVRARLGADDRKRLDEHAAAIRDVERTLATMNPSAAPGAAGALSCRQPALDTAALGGQTRFANVIPNMHKVAALQHEVMLLALRCDLSRVVTVMFMKGRADTQPYEFLPIGDRTKGQHAWAHSWSNATRSPTGARDYGQVHIWRAELFRDLVARLKAIPDEEGTTLFDNTLLAWISEMGDGSHNHRFLPWVLAGRAGGQLKTGRALRLDAPHTNALISIAALMGVSLPSFGLDGTTALPL
jgi:hypothetical protein